MLKKTIQDAFGLNMDLNSTAPLQANRKLPNTGGWQDRHDEALRNPRIGFESALVRMMVGWFEYAEEHKQRYESVIGNDHVLGDEWEAMGDALRGLLNGSLERLDAGTLDSFVLKTMRSNGIDTDTK